MTFKPFVFLDDTSTTGESEPADCMGAEQLTVSVESSGSVDIDVYGKIDANSATWHQLGVISLADYSAAESISDTGVYVVFTNGVNAVKIINNGTAGSCTVVGNLVGAEPSGAW